MSLDTTFNKPDGFVVEQFFEGQSSTGNSFVNDSNNNTIVVGTVELYDGITKETTNYLVLAKYTEEGVLDQTFAGGLGYITVQINNYSTDGTFVTLDKDDNILITGTVSYTDPITDQYVRYMYVTKYDKDGVLDDTFNGNNGYIIQQFFGTNNVYCKCICIDNDNNILVTGTAFDNDDVRVMFIVRYTDTGDLDITFNGVGFVTKNFNDLYTLGQYISVDTDDSIYVTGNCFDPDNNSYIFLAKYTKIGILDITFGDGGFVVKQFVQNLPSDSTSLIIDADHNIYITGSVVISTNPADTGIFNVYVARYTNNGDLDTNFADGKGFINTMIENYNSGGTSLAFDQDSNILVTGDADFGSGVSYKNFIVKYTIDGALDTKFGNGNGYVLTQPDNYVSRSIRQMMIDSNNRILTIGVANTPETYFFFLGRYLNIDTTTTTTITTTTIQPTTTTTTKRPPKTTTTTTTHYEPICLPAGTPIITDQGIIAIEKIDTNKHTINNQRIVAITRNITPENHLIHFNKHSISINCPTQNTLMTPGHCVFYRGKLVQAKYFVGRLSGVSTVPYNGNILYNVLMDKHNVMNVNGMVLETLHPDNKIAKKILENNTTQ